MMQNRKRKMSFDLNPPQNLTISILKSHFQLHMLTIGLTSVTEWIVNMGHFLNVRVFPCQSVTSTFPKNCLSSRLAVDAGVRISLSVLANGPMAALHRPKSRQLSPVTSPWTFRHHRWVSTTGSAVSSLVSPAALCPLDLWLHWDIIILEVWLPSVIL